MRLLIIIDSDERFIKSADREQFIQGLQVYVNDFPCRTNGGDLIRLEDFVNEDTIASGAAKLHENSTEITEEWWSQIYALSYSVDFTVWEKDSEGAYQKIFITGE